MKINETTALLEGSGSRALMEKLYGSDQVEANIVRYKNLLKGFEMTFGDQDVLLFHRRAGQRSVETIRTIITARYLPAALIWTAQAWLQKMIPGKYGL